MRIFIKKSIAIVLSLLCIVSSLAVTVFADTNWQMVGNVAFAEGELIESAFSAYNGTVYVAYRTSENQCSIIVKKFNSSSWETVGTAQQCQYSTKGLSINVSNGTPYLTYMENLTDTTGSKYSRIIVKKFVNNTWEELGNQGLDDLLLDGIAFQIDNGTLYLAYKRVLGIGPTATNRLTVKKYNGTSWDSVGNLDFLSGKFLDVMLEVSNGKPYIASRNHDTNKLKVMKFSGDSWINVGEEVSNEGNVASMDVYNGIPYISFSNSSRKLIVKKYEGGTWTDVGSIEVTGRLGNNIVQIKEGTPWLCYVNTEKVFVMKYNGTVWEPLGGEIVSGRGIQFAIENGIPYIGFTEGLAQPSKLMRYNQPVIVNNSGTAASTQVNLKPAIEGIAALKVSAVAGPGYVKLSWNSLSGIKGVVGYYVYKSTLPGDQTYAPVTDMWIKDTTYTDTKVQTGTTYYYKVRPVLLGNASKEVAVAVAGTSTNPLSQTKSTLMPMQSSTSWSGIWGTDYGSMLLMQKGTEVYGTYGDKEYKLSGTVTGSKLTGTIDEGGGYLGEFEFIMTATGKTFTGKWRYSSDSEWSVWEGSR